MITTWKLPNSKVYHGLNNAWAYAYLKNITKFCPHRWYRYVKIWVLAHGLIRACKTLVSLFEYIDWDKYCKVSNCVQVINSLGYRAGTFSILYELSRNSIDLIIPEVIQFDILCLYLLIFSRFLVLTYFSGSCFLFRILKLTTQGKWSDIALDTIDVKKSVRSLKGTLEHIWSIKRCARFVMRVGRVIVAKKLLVHIKSKISTYFSRSFICNNFILKSISSINFSMFLLLLLSWGGLYMFPMVKVLLKLCPLTSMERP